LHDFAQDQLEQSRHRLDTVVAQLSTQRTDDFQSLSEHLPDLRQAVEEESRKEEELIKSLASTLAGKLERLRQSLQLQRTVCLSVSGRFFSLCYYRAFFSLETGRTTAFVEF
jgi:exonuclease VII large subunit